MREMELSRTRARAEELMDELGKKLLGRSLRELGWTFHYDSAARRLGMAQWTKRGVRVKRISLSKSYVTLNGLDFVDGNGVRAVEDTIRHEIAHAVDYERRGRSGHDGVWKALAVQCGAQPTRFYKGDAKVKQLRFTLSCASCSRTWQRTKVDHGQYFWCPKCSRPGAKQFLWVRDNQSASGLVFQPLPGGKVVYPHSASGEAVATPTGMPLPAHEAAAAAQKAPSSPSSGTKPARGIGARAVELLKQGLSNKEVLEVIHREFPGAKTSLASIRWYRSNKL